MDSSINKWRSLWFHFDHFCFCSLASWSKDLNSEVVTFWIDFINTVQQYSRRLLLNTVWHRLYLKSGMSIPPGWYFRPRRGRTYLDILDLKAYIFGHFWTFLGLKAYIFGHFWIPKRTCLDILIGVLYIWCVDYIYSYTYIRHIMYYIVTCIYDIYIRTVLSNDHELCTWWCRLFLKWWVSQTPDWLSVPQGASAEFDKVYSIFIKNVYSKWKTLV